MDLRVKKTKRAIRSAFYELIKEKPLEKITVKEIAERAEINKTTFYAHYETVYDLVDQLEQEAVAEIVRQINTAQDLLDNPRAFVKGIYAALDKNWRDMDMIPAPAMTQFTAHLRNAILEKIKQDGIDSAQYENVGALLVFIFNGIAGLQTSAPELAAAQLDTIAAFVEAGVKVLPKP
ncbi:TetR/AcrR family transcriptional regulator [Gemmiger sp.]